MKELIQLINVYDKEKDRAKDLEFQMAEYREEVLKLKSEKKETEFKFENGRGRT
jgi:hypothetical protein